ncbi:uncharacterized protein LOC107615944 [Arachis ipaensis]|uniref:uncharacterized protein LOC107615944 n=1 Tax=Arachis ipaensis TaxID=130454 RepID=UPI0007AFBBBE|nr:uncharacterized protein LOC107615944 [Arachis ipaensis]
MERALQAQHVLENQYVKFATYRLEGETQVWWEGARRLLQQDNEAITWEIFKVDFYKKYFPNSVRVAKKLELMQLKQVSMMVIEYMSEFEELCRFSKFCQGAPEGYEEWKCIKYEGGFRDDIMSTVVPMEIRSFPELVNKSRVVEECSRKSAVARNNCKKFYKKG